MARQNGKKTEKAEKSDATPAVKAAAPKKAAAPRKTPARKAAAPKPATPPAEVDFAVSAALAPEPGRVPDSQGTTQHLLVSRGGHVLSLSLDGGPGVVPLSGALDAKLPLFVTWLLDAPGLARPDVVLKAVTLHARLGDTLLPPVLVTDERTFAGELVRLPTRLELPADASGELEYWFEVETTSGETLWHSHFGKNFRLPIASGTRAVEQLSAMLESASALQGPADLRA